MDDPNPERDTTNVPVIDLSKAPGERSTWDRPVWVVLLWSITELLLVTNPWQISSSIRVRALRAFGASIGDGVIFRPRTRVRFPWKLSVGDRSWIGEGVWFHNQAEIHVGADVVISQETFLTTGSHRHRIDMGLITRRIQIHDGAWITSRCIVLGGAVVGRSALAQPMTVVRGAINPNSIVAGSDCHIVGQRFAN